MTLLKEYNSSTPIAWYLVASAVISIIAVAGARETRGKSLRAVDEESLARTADR
ncbi:hypothetical protein D3C81_2205640 [compost metagenome]